MSASQKHQLTDAERMAIDCLRGVTFPVASWDKRFYRDVLSPAKESGLLGEKSSPQLWRMFIRYRRQISHPDKGTLMAVAEKLAAPDFRRQQAAANAQAIINQMKAAAT